jgi:Mg/Co/Ni transporter MgtE
VTAALMLVEQYVTTHPEGAARRVERASDADQARIVASLPPPQCATLLRHMAPAMAVRALSTLNPEAAADALALLPLDLTASLVRRLDAVAAEPLLDAMPATLREAVRALLAHAPNTAGGVMDPLVLTVPLAATVGEARTIVEREPGHLYYYVFVVDGEHRLTGVCDLAELMQADPADPLQVVVKAGVVWIAASTPLDAVVVHPAWQHFDALPVVGESRRFLGLLRHRRVRQIVAQGAQATGQDGAVRTVVALGEIYWLGLCGLLQGISATASEPAAAKEEA